MQNFKLACASALSGLVCCCLYIILIILQHIVFHVYFLGNAFYGSHCTESINMENKNFGILFRTLTFIDKDMLLNLYKSMARPLRSVPQGNWSTRTRVRPYHSQLVPCFGQLVPSLVNSYLVWSTGT